MSFVPGQTLSAADLNGLALEGTYEVLLTCQDDNLSPGANWTADGWYFLNGKCIDVWFNFQFGTGASGGTGIYYISYPPGYAPRSGFPSLAAGTVRLMDSSGGTEELGYLSLTSTQMYPTRSTTGGFVTGTSPWTWSDGDSLLGHATYLID